MSTFVSNAFTVDDLEAMPDDGRRYELIGGAIVITPAPEPLHQRVEFGLARRIEDSCPPGHEVFVSPIDIDLPGGQRVEPDIIVVPHASVGEKRLSGQALLVVEIVSPGSVVNDQVTKHEVYAEAGVPAYEPYADTAGPVTLDWPVAVSFSVADLARPRSG